MNAIARTLAAAVLLAACAAAHAQQVYRWVDKDGRVHYTEQPPPADARNVERRRISDDAADPAAVAEAAAAAKKNPVTLYVSSDCAQPCSDARQLLARRGVPHRVVDVADAATFEQLKKVTGGENVPVMVVGGAINRGFEEETWQAALDSAGYPRSIPAPVRSTQPAKPPAPKPPARGRYESALPEPPATIALYISDDCGAPCDEARKLLASRGVQANIIPVVDPGTFEDLQRISGGTTVPVLVLGSRVVKGFEPGQYNAALDAFPGR